MRIRSVVFLCLISCLAVFAAPAQSDTILGCGSVVSENVVLQHDIGPCPEDGLLVHGGGVTIDLNGHLIAGSNGSGVGIRVEGQREFKLADVSVRNGSVEGFSRGVAVVAGTSGCLGSSMITIERLTLRSNGGGISVFVFCGGAVNVTRNWVKNNAGVGISAGAGNLNGPIHILDNHVVGNAGTGIRGAFDSVRRVEGNFVAHNGGNGIHLDDTVSSVKDNFMQKNGGIGLVITDTFAPYLSRYVVADNVADGNEGGGMTASASPFTAEQLTPAGSGNSAKHNGNFQCVLIVCAKNRGQAKKG